MFGVAVGHFDREHCIATSLREARVVVSRTLWIGALGGMTVVGQLSLGWPRPAFAGPGSCTVSGTTATCEGDHSAGINTRGRRGVTRDFDASIVTTLNVGSLTSDIEPTVGTRGIEFFRFNGPLRLNSDTGQFSISTKGSQRTYGINVVSFGGSAEVVFRGSILATGRGSGIEAYSSMDQVTVTSEGNITTGFWGINARGYSVTVKSTGDITTSERRRGVGILAEVPSYATEISPELGNTMVTSVGNISTFGGSSIGIDASGATVVVQSQGNITTEGDLAHGIVAESNATDGTGSVQVISSGNVTTIGRASSGIMAFASGDVAVNVTSGTVTGGSSRGAGISIRSSKKNSTLTNAGTITSVVGIGGNAIGGGGKVSVYNSGTITGLVDLGNSPTDSPHTKAFNNQEGGTFNTGATVILGEGNVLTNAGTLSPGGNGPVQTTTLIGDLTQTGSGRFAVDIGHSPENGDKIYVIGTAEVAGTVVANVQNPTKDAQQWVILSSRNGTQNNGLAAVSTKPFVKTDLIFPNAVDVVLQASLNFAGNSLSPNRVALGNHLNATLATETDDLEAVINGLLKTQSETQYKNAFDQLMPGVYLETEVGTLFSSLNFADALMTCRSQEGVYAVIRTGHCVWAQANARWLDRDATSDVAGYREDTEQFAGGAQFKVAPHWYLGMAGSYEQSIIKSNAGARSSGDRAHGGVALKFTHGPFALSAALSGGRGWYDTTRAVGFGGLNEVASSSHDVSYLSGTLRAEYRLQNVGWYVKPFVDVSVTKIHLDDVRETGANGVNLDVDGGDDIVVSASPAVEIGGQFAFADGTRLRPFLRFGATFFSNSNFATTSTFDGTPTGISGFTTTTSIDAAVADVSVGAEIFTSNNLSLKLNYSGRFGDTTRQHGFGGRATVRF